MPTDVKKALSRNKVMELYRQRPAYQQNDYIGWILQAKREETRAKRIAQMVSELKKGDVYMRMKWKSKS